MLDRTIDPGERAAETAQPGKSTKFGKKRRVLLAVLAIKAKRVAYAAQRLPARVGAFFHGTWQVLLVDGISGILRHAWQLFVEQSFSSLTRRIIVINMIGLVAFVAGILFLSQLREGLIDARVQSLVVQGEIIAGAIAASATVETDAITTDPDRLLELQTGESYGPPDES
ncbi:MAG: sensor N-terminal transmembrane domain-containing protein, partial [Xanthobacteraceae bacterium]